MNELNVNLQHSILTLAGNGWSNRRIARELDINRETVGKYLLLARPKPAISTPGSAPDPNSNPAIPTSGSGPPPDSKPAISTAGSVAGRQSLCLPHSPQIEAAVGVGLSAQRIYQDLVCDPLEEWGKLLGDVPTAGAILDRFLHHAQTIAITGRSYRLKDHAAIAGKEDKNKKAKSKSNEPSTAEPAS